MQWMDTYSEWAPVSGLALIILSVVLIVAMLRAVRRSGLYALGRRVTLPLVLAWEAQGLHGLALDTGLDGVAAWVVAGLTSAILATLAAGADQHHQRHGTLGWPGRLVWVVAVPMGLIVAMSADTAAEQGLRIVLPLLAAMLWWVQYAPTLARSRAKGEAVDTDTGTTWRWTPRRLAERVGILGPDSRELRVRRLVTAGHRLAAGHPRLRARRLARLQRLARTADDSMVTEARERMARTLTIAHTLSPGAIAQDLGLPVVLSVDSSTGTLATNPTPADDKPAPGVTTNPTPADDKPAPGVTTKRPARKRASTAERVARAVAKTPDASSAEIAARLRLSERTVQRYRSEMTPPLSTANGTGDTTAVVSSDV